MYIKVTIETPATILWLDFLEMFVWQTFSKMDLQRDEGFCFAIREVLLNAIQVSEGKESIEPTVNVKVIVEKSDISVLVSDDGEGMALDWKEKLQDQSMEKRLPYDSGRGLLFMQKFVDEMWSEYDSNGRHIFGLKKKGVFTNEQND